MDQALSGPSFTDFGRGLPTTGSRLPVAVREIQIHASSCKCAVSYTKALFLCISIYRMTIFKTKVFTTTKNLVRQDALFKVACSINIKDVST